MSLTWLTLLFSATLAVAVAVYAWRRDRKVVADQAAPFVATLIATFIGVLLSLAVDRYAEQSKEQDTLVGLLSNAWVLTDTAENVALGAVERQKVDPSDELIARERDLSEVWSLSNSVEYAKLVSPEGRLQIRTHMNLVHDTMSVTPHRPPLTAKYAQSLMNLARVIGIEILYQQGSISHDRLAQCEKDFPFPPGVVEPHQPPDWPCDRDYAALRKLRPYPRDRAARAE
ncbi:MAG: hypothetical protein HY270_05290 [Deltaproteobacteria bacterium]|nr:hypothetical protein [Deltaproteobacteria bacterium]